MRVYVSVEGFEAPAELLETAVARALADGGVEDIEVSVTLLTDADIRRMNRDRLGHDRPTDVIAFTLEGVPTLGDVYIGFEQARVQAGEHGIDLTEELVRLAIHGTLHVLGHDHAGGADRTTGPMFQLQERLVREVLSRRRPDPFSSST